MKLLYLATVKLKIQNLIGTIFTIRIFITIEFQNPFIQLISIKVAVF